MSINALFHPNDYNLFCNNLNAQELVVVDNLDLQGNLSVANNKKISMGSWAGSDANIPDHIDLWGGLFGLGITAGHLNLIASGSNHVSIQTMGAQQMDISSLGIDCQQTLLVNNGLKDHTASIGTNGQVLTSTGTQVEWSTSAAQSQIFLNSKGTALDTGFIGQAGFTNTGADASYSFAKASTIVGIFVQINAAPGAGTWDFNVQKDGVNSALSVSMTGVTTQANASGSISYNQGDNFTLAVTKTGAPPAVSACFVTLIYQ